MPYSLVVDARITAVKAGIPLEADKVAAHYLAGGNVVPTDQALVAAQKAGIALNWDRACAIDLACKGTAKTVLDAVRTSINPKVIESLFAGDLAYLQDLYSRVNASGHNVLSVACPHCEEEFEVEIDTAGG